jgi:hypothetical protein
MALDITQMGLAGIGLDVVKWLCQNVGGFLNLKTNSLPDHVMMKGKGWKIYTYHKTTFISIDDPVLELQFKLTWL